MTRTIFCLVGLLCIIFVSARTKGSNRDCSKVKSNKYDILCEKWNFLRFLWSPETVQAVEKNKPINSIPLSIPRPTGDCNYTDPITKSTWFGYSKQFGVNNSVFGLYDVQGQIAGMQARFRHAATNVPGNSYRHDLVPMYQNQSINGELYYVLTAYFVDPKKICSKGRPKSAVRTNEGTGDRLVFQNGSDPSYIHLAPKIRGDALNNGYLNNACFNTMGNHSYYTGGADWVATNCSQMFPIILMYNKADYLVGFAFYWVGLNEATTSFETGGPMGMRASYGDPVPQCALNYANNPNISVTSMHVFMVNRNPGKEC